MKPGADPAGRTVLLVEDESLVSLLAEDVLTVAGFRVILAMRLREGLEIAEREPLDFAVLDVNLGGGTDSFPIAEALRRRNIPFVFVTGYDAPGLDAAFRHAQVIQKPYDPADLVAAVQRIASAA